MKVNLQSPIEDAQVQIIPLIDVIFCILTFFLLAALQFTRQQAINVDLPKANTGSAPQMRQMLIVTLDAFGQTYVEQEPVTSDILTQRLQAYRASNPDGLMVLNASRTSSYNDVVQVLDTLREVGGSRVALATLPSSTQSPSTPLPGTTPVTPINPYTAPIPTIPPAPPASNQLLLPNAPGAQSVTPRITPVPPAPVPQATTMP